MGYKEELMMILKNQIITNIKIESVNDLYKLKPFLEDGTLKINKSQIARELEVDRRTVDKYINGYTKPETRNCNDCITPFYDIIAELLSDRNQQVFYYRKVLWQYLVDNHGFTGVYCNFCHYLKKYPEFDSYFRKGRPSNTNKVTVRYETPMGKQAQLDWKESIPFTLSSGETIDVNVFVLLLSYSRFRVYRVSLSKTQDILFSFLDDAFETFGGVPDEIVTDNMKTVMDESNVDGAKLAAFIDAAVADSIKELEKRDDDLSKAGVTMLGNVDGKSMVERMSPQFLEFVLDAYRSLKYTR